MRVQVLVLCTVLLTLSGCKSHKSPFKYQEVMIPVRDSVRLQTVILTPVSQSGTLPILFRRTPYGVPDKAPDEIPASLKELMKDGYTYVIQTLRGRCKSA